MAEVTYPPEGAGCRALSTSRPCPGYCTARVGATAKQSRNQSAMVPLLGRASWPLSLFLLLGAAVARAKCGILYHVPSIQARNQVTHKVILRFVLSTVLTPAEICQSRLKVIVSTPALWHCPSIIFSTKPGITSLNLTGLINFNYFQTYHERDKGLSHQVILSLTQYPECKIAVVSAC